MTPPIASPHETKSLPRKTPFLGLQIFVATDAFLGIGSLFGSYNSPSSPLSRSEIGEIVFFVGIVVVLWVWLLWRLWCRSNGARTLFWCISAAGIISTAFLGFENQSAPVWVRWIDYTQAAFLLFGLVWLQLPGVKRHFRRDQAA